MNATGAERSGVLDLCRLDHRALAALERDEGTGRLALLTAAATVVASAAYGASFGAWRGPEQAFVAAVKMPFLVLTVVLLSGVINTMMAQVLGARLSGRQVLVCMLLGLTIMSMLLAAFAPVALFFAATVPDAASPAAMEVYRALLVAHTALIACCGLFGHVRLYQVLRHLTRSRALAARVLAAWIAMTGLVGCEASWLFSPFLSRPGFPAPLLNPNAFTSNFFEYLWRASCDGFEEWER